MKKLIPVTCFIFIIHSLCAQTSICSWNLKDFGQSKSDAELNFIANTVNAFDIICLQEVVAGYGGSQAVARLHNALNKKGTQWDYRVSLPTSGENSYKRERYAFLWKTATIHLIGRPWLEIKYQAEINREPFFATFSNNGKLFTVVNFHAITKSKQPETEIKYFKFLPEEYPHQKLIFTGDFNCPQSHSVFNPLKTMGYKPVFKAQKTSLRMQCLDSNCLASEFDNIFYNVSEVNNISSGIIHFYKSFTTLPEARNISDHVPVWFRFVVY